MDTLEIHTPTTSELATFQVLANLDFVNLNKQQNYIDDEYTVADVDVKVVDDEEELLPPLPLPIPDQESVKEDVKSAKEEEDDFVDSPPKTYVESPPRSIPRSFRVPRDSLKSEIEAEKEGLLSELQNLEKQGYKPHRQLTMDDSLEEIQFHYDRIQAEVNANQIVDFAKSSIKMGSGMMEMMMKRSGVKVVDGYHNNLCKDMNKFNRPLNRLYKKYWRRGGLSPEAELGLIIFGSLAYTVVQNKMTGSPPSTPSEHTTQDASQNIPKPPSMKPPQMTSLNVPTSWSTEQKSTEQKSQDDKAAQLLKSTEEKLRQLDLARDDMNQREMSLRKLMMSLEEKSAKLDKDILTWQHEKDRLKEEIEDSETSEDEEVRKVVLQQSSATPRKSAKRKTVALDLS